MSTQNCSKWLSLSSLRLCFAINAKVRQFFDYHMMASGETAGKPRATIAVLTREDFFRPCFMLR